MKTNSSASAHTETSVWRFSSLLAGAVAVAALLPMPTGALESKSIGSSASISDPLPLPALPHLETMPWMSWKPAAPLLKTETLLIPEKSRLLPLGLKQQA